MGKIVILAGIILLSFLGSAQAQWVDSKGDFPSYDTLKQQILAIKTDVDEMKFNLQMGRKRLQQGIIVATLGYSITIAGGLILGRNDDLGKALLVTGGLTGITGTFLLVDGFRYIGQASRPRTEIYWD